MHPFAASLSNTPSRDDTQTLWQWMTGATPTTTANVVTTTPITEEPVLVSTQYDTLTPCPAYTTLQEMSQAHNIRIAPQATNDEQGSCFVSHEVFTCTDLLATAQEQGDRQKTQQYRLILLTLLKMDPFLTKTRGNVDTTEDTKQIQREALLGSYTKP